VAKKKKASAREQRPRDGKLEIKHGGKTEGSCKVTNADEALVAHEPTDEEGPCQTQKTHGGAEPSGGTYA